MRDDPILPAAIITRQKMPDRREYFRSVTWELDPTARRLICRFATLQEADAAVRYRKVETVVPREGESTDQMRQRQEEHARELEARQAERRRDYGP